jgi:hypothetical protein
LRRFGNGGAKASGRGSRNRLPGRLRTRREPGAADADSSISFHGELGRGPRAGAAIWGEAAGLRERELGEESRAGESEGCWFADAALGTRGAEAVVAEQRGGWHDGTRRDDGARGKDTAAVTGSGVADGSVWRGLVDGGGIPGKGRRGRGRDRREEDGGGGGWRGGTVRVVDALAPALRCSRDRAASQVKLIE